MALNQQEVQSLIDTPIAQVRADLNFIIQADGAEAVKEIAAHRIEIESHRAAHLDTMQRITDLINGQNMKSTEVVNEIRARKNDHGAAAAVQDPAGPGGQGAERDDEPRRQVGHLQ